jgi:hypothetical protein
MDITLNWTLENNNIKIDKFNVNFTNKSSLGLKLAANTIY